MEILSKSQKGSFWDGLGAALSLVCAVHCALLPFVLALLPLAGLAFLKDERLEIGLILTSLSVAAFALARGFGRHRDWRVPAVGLMGTVLWGCGHFFLAQPWEGLAMGLGGCHLAAAQWLNLRLCRHCDACQDGERNRRFQGSKSGGMMNVFWVWINFKRRL
ncbi:MAG TPA: MerC domain-containing protein, partial [bacterium]|nr:MerC domain-containing protein [bacterium]